MHHVRFAKGDSDSQVKAKELLLKDLNNGMPPMAPATTSLR